VLGAAGGEGGDLDAEGAVRRPSVNLVRAGSRLDRTDEIVNFGSRELQFTVGRPV